MPSHEGREYTFERLANHSRTLTRVTECSQCGNEYDYNRLIRGFNGYPIIVCIECMGNLSYLMESNAVFDYLNSAYCTNCSINRNIFSMRFRNNEIMCENCYFVDSWECYYCHNRYDTNDVPYRVIASEYDNMNVCDNCHGHNYDLILPYTFDPQFKFYSTNRDKRELLYFGIELEVESNGNDKREAIDTLPDCVYVKADSSIMNGFEIVSHPMTYNWLMDNYKVWDKILELRKRGWRSYNTESCGMHIHLSKNAFGNWHLYKFIKLFYDNRDFILKFSQRKGVFLDRWASLNDNEQNIRHKARCKHRGNEDRHTAVNLERDFSVEVRIFRGTLNPMSFWKNIEFTKALFDFSRDYPLESMHEIEFRNFIRFERKMYPNLHNFMWGESKVKYTVEK